MQAVFKEAVTSGNAFVRIGTGLLVVHDVDGHLIRVSQAGIPSGSVPKQQWVDQSQCRKSHECLGEIYMYEERVGVDREDEIMSDVAYRGDLHRVDEDMENILQSETLRFDVREIVNTVSVVLSRHMSYVPSVNVLRLKPLDDHNQIFSLVEIEFDV